MKYAFRMTEEQRLLLVQAMASHRQMHPEQFDSVAIPAQAGDGFIYDHYVSSPATDLEHRLLALPRRRNDQLNRMYLMHRPTKPVQRVPSMVSQIGRCDRCIENSVPCNNSCTLAPFIPSWAS